MSDVGLGVNVDFGDGGGGVVGRLPANSDRSTQRPSFGLVHRSAVVRCATYRSRAAAIQTVPRNRLAQSVMLKHNLLTAPFLDDNSWNAVDESIDDAVMRRKIP